VPDLWGGHMSAVQIIYRSRPPLPRVPTYIAYCCREWIAPILHKGTTCGICGEYPTYLRPDPDSAVL
jgi:hypothetical protein